MANESIRQMQSNNVCLRAIGQTRQKLRYPEYQTISKGKVMDVLSIVYLQICSGGFRGCSWGQLPPLHDENLAFRSIFGKKGAPYPDPNALFFRVSF